MTSNRNIVEKWKEQSEELFNTVEMPSCQKAVTEISGVFESISVTKVIVPVKNPHSNKAVRDLNILFKVGMAHFFSVAWISAAVFLAHKQGWGPYLNFYFLMSMFIQT